MPPDKEQEIPQKILDKEGLKVSSIPGTDKKVIVPKEVEDSDKRKKFIKGYANVKNLLGMDDSITAGEFLNLFSYFVQSVLESKVSEREERYNQMDFILENDGALSLSRKVLNDEIMQTDVFDKPITVTAKNVNFKKAIEKLFKSLGVKDLIKPLGRDLISYGDGFWVMDIDRKEGIQKLIPVDVRDVRHRFEFSIADLRKEKTKLIKKFTGLQTVIELGSKLSTTASYFNRVLLGFQILNTIFPFWQVLHFRQFTTRKKLWPFGMPTFYESQSEARMYLNAKVIVSMIRSSAFIREHIKVRTSEDMDPAEQWELVSQVRQMMELFISRGGKTSKDMPSFGDKIYYPEGLMEVEKVEAGFNFRDRYEDLQLMREDVFTSTGMPKGYFVGEGGQYVPIKALMQQDKKTARLVFDLQNIIISQLIKLVEVHFSFTEEFDPYKEEFGISLPYPIPDIDDSMIGISRAKMEYAVGIIDSLKTALGIVKIPEEIVKKLLATYFPVSDEEISIIIKQMKKDAKDAEKSGIDPYSASYGDPFGIQKTQVDQMQQQQDMETQMAAQQPEMPIGAAPEKTSEIPAEEPQQPSKEDLLRMSPEELVKLGLSDEEIEQIMVEKERLAADYNRKQNHIYEQQFYKAIKDNPLSETVAKVLNESVISKRQSVDEDEFIHMGRHFVFNSYASLDRNNNGIVSLNEHMNEALKAVSAQDNPEIKLNGLDPLKDTKEDRRYLNEEERKARDKKINPS